MPPLTGLLYLSEHEYLDERERCSTGHFQTQAGVFPPSHVVCVDIAAWLGSPVKKCALATFSRGVMTRVTESASGAFVSREPWAI